MSNVGFSGVRKLSRYMVNLSKYQDVNQREKWEPFFEYWWGFSIKYFVPFALSFLLMFSLDNDTTNRYGGYHMFWQIMGFIFPIVGLLIFFISIFVCNQTMEFEEGVNAVYDPNDHQGQGEPSSYEAERKRYAEMDKAKAQAELVAVDSAKVSPGDQ